MQGNLPRHPERKASTAAILAEFDTELQPDIRRMTVFTGAAFYTPVPTRHRSWPCWSAHARSGTFLLMYATTGGRPLLCGPRLPRDPDDARGKWLFFLLD